MTSKLVLVIQDGLDFIIAKPPWSQLLILPVYKSSGCLLVCLVFRLCCKVLNFDIDTSRGSIYLLHKSTRIDSGLP